MDERDSAQRLGTDSVRFERLLPGPIERVWAYLTDSDKRGLWLATGAMEPRQGTCFTLRFHNTGLTPDRTPPSQRFRRYDTPVTTHHQVLRYEPPHVLSWTWGGGSEAPSEVTFELSEDGDQVRLVVTHRRSDDVGTMVNVAGGWHTHLTILADVLRNTPPTPFWTMFERVEKEYQCRFVSSQR